MSYLRILFAGIAMLALAACEQPAPEVAPEQDAAAEASETAPAGDEKLVSVDADGNIAPFGFASKQPVDVPELEAPAEPEPAASEAPAEAATAATSEVYAVHCVACHGADAKGVQGLGLNLVEGSCFLVVQVWLIFKELQVINSLDKVVSSCTCFVLHDHTILNNWIHLLRN